MAQNDCENCHKRAKYGTHKYCGKTCASQAATRTAGSLASVSSSGYNRAPVSNAPQKAVQCIYCGKKPKFRNSDYCTKSCAALATTAGSNQATVHGKQPAKPNLSNVRHVAQNNSGPVRTHNVKKAAQAQAPVAEDSDSSDYPPSDSASDEVGEEETDLSAYPTDSEEELAAPAPLGPPPTTKPTIKAGKTNVPATKAICAIPHCGKPVHEDKTGVSTSYCSIKHREEAVTLKLKAPCILCKRYPQSDSDYFCSKACRNQAMLKTQ